MNEQELCERLEGLGFSPGRLMRQASNETREAVSAVFSSGESNGDSSGAADGSSEQQRAQLQLIQDALQSQQDRFELGRVERHGLLRAIRHGQARGDVRGVVEVGVVAVVDKKGATTGVSFFGYRVGAY